MGCVWVCFVPLCCVNGCTVRVLFPLAHNCTPAASETERLNHAIQQCLQLTGPEHLNVPSPCVQRILYQCIHQCCPFYFKLPPIQPTLHDLHIAGGG